MPETIGTLLGEPITIDTHEDFETQTIQTIARCGDRALAEQHATREQLAGLRPEIAREYLKEQVMQLVRQSLNLGELDLRVGRMTPIRDINASISSGCSVHDLRDFPGHVGLRREPMRQQLSAEHQQKAEKKALVLFQNNYGPVNCDLYRRNRIVLAQAKKFAWLIGDLEGSYNEQHPFNCKPDVARVDMARLVNRIFKNKAMVTYFCVMNRASDPMPYTDKVIALLTHIQLDEAQFLKNANRIKEAVIKKLPVCANVTLD